MSAGPDAASVDALLTVLVPEEGTAVPEEVEVLVRDDDQREFTFSPGQRDGAVLVPAEGLELPAGEQVTSQALLPGGTVRLVQRN